jgi:hypothetical protein
METKQMIDKCKNQITFIERACLGGALVFPLGIKEQGTSNKHAHIDLILERLKQSRSTFFC